VIGVRLAPEDADEATPWLTPPSRRRKEASIPAPLPETLELALGNECEEMVGKNGTFSLPEEL